MKLSRNKQRFTDSVRKLERRIDKIRKEEEGRGNKIKVTIQLTVEVSNHIGVISQPDSEVLMHEVFYDTADT